MIWILRKINFGLEFMVDFLPHCKTRDEMLLRIIDNDISLMKMEVQAIEKKQN